MLCSGLDRANHLLQKRWSRRRLQQEEPIYALWILDRLALMLLRLRLLWLIDVIATLQQRVMVGLVFL